MKSVINWLSKMLESMANAFMHPLKNDLPPSIGTHAYSSIPIKRKKEVKFLIFHNVFIRQSFKKISIKTDLLLSNLVRR